MHPQLHALSSTIVERALQQSIIAPALSSCMPRKIVYQNCTQDAARVELSLVRLQNNRPDCSPMRIVDAGDDQVYRDVALTCKKPVPILPAPKKPDNYYTKPTILNLRKPSIALNYRQGQLSRIQSQTDLEFRTRPTHQDKQIRQIKSYARFYPSSSTHQLQGKSDHKYTGIVKLTESELGQNDSEQIIKQFRQNLIFKPYYSQNAQKIERGKRMADSKQVKKVKDPQPKKFMALTTDYSGFWVHMNKGDINRESNHYVQVEVAEVMGDKEENQAAKNHSKHNIQLDLQNQHINYKQLRIIEKQSPFITKILKKVKNNFKSAQEISEQEEKILNKNQQLNEMTLSGKTYKPLRVGFHIFEKMKQEKSKMEREKCQIKQQKQVVSSQLKKKWAVRHKQSLKDSRILSAKQNGQQKAIKKCQNIQLGNRNAVNFLLNPDQKTFKKRVKINQNCL